MADEENSPPGLGSIIRDPSTSEQVRDLPLGVRDRVAIFLSELQATDGGLSEESVTSNGAISVTAVIIRNLSNRRHPLAGQLLEYANSHPTVGSELTEESFIRQIEHFADAPEELSQELHSFLQDAIDLASTAASQEDASVHETTRRRARELLNQCASDELPEHAQKCAKICTIVEKQSPEEKSTFFDCASNADHLATNEVPGVVQHSCTISALDEEITHHQDDEEVNLDEPLLTSIINEEPFPSVSWKIFTPHVLQTLVGMCLFVAIAFSGAFALHHHSARRRSDRQNKDRAHAILDCASKISKRELSERETPHRWIAAHEFLTGSGQGITTEYCDTRGSLFSLLYAIFVIREAFHVSDDAWYDESKAIQYPTDICDRFERITCDGPGISGLSLNNAKLWGTIPSEVSWLLHLTKFEIFSNPNVGGTIPKELGLMTHLETLMIQKTSVSGIIPTQLGALTALENFVLYDTKLSGDMPREICDLKLHHLTASCNGGKYSIHCGSDCCTHCVSPTSHYSPLIGAALK